MPDVHLPHLDDEGETAAGPLPPDAHGAPPDRIAGKARHRSKSLLKIGLEVLLIGTGVFLGLMGEQWRERAQHRERAEAALRSFRTEIQTNRTAITGVKDYHVTMLKKLEAYIASDRPKTPKTFDIQINGLRPVFFERTAWDLAVATGSLAHIDPKLAFALSRAYTGQQAIADLTRAIMQSVIYGRSWTGDFEGYWRSVSYYFADVAIMEPALLGVYDEVLPQIDRALGESPAMKIPSK